MHFHQRHIFAKLDLPNATACFAFQSRHRYQGSITIIDSSCLPASLVTAATTAVCAAEQSGQQLHNSHHKHKEAQAAEQTQHST
jgi:hypothetical protein